MTEETDTTQNTVSRGTGFWAGVSLAIVAMLALGWYVSRNSETKVAAAEDKTVECAPIPEGKTWDGKQLVAAAAIQADPKATSPAQPSGDSDWTPSVEAQFAGLGFGWMGLELSGDGVDVTGTAPGRQSRQIGFDIAQQAVRSADKGAHADLPVRNRITLQEGRADWTNAIEDSLHGIGYDWLSISVLGDAAYIGGTAPNAGEMDEAFRIASEAIARNPLFDVQTSTINNRIALAGEDDGGAAIVADFMQDDVSDQTVESCNATFDRILDGRTIKFGVNSANITDENARLLDSLTDTAKICVNDRGYVIEVAGHTDASGSTADNNRLSLERAQAVRQYLVRSGVNRDQLAAAGYGSMQLLPELPPNDNAHRRTEFTVTNPD